MGWGNADVPTGRVELCAALADARERTLKIYDGIPPDWWEPARFPYMEIVNPPLWELVHIGWFAEFFGVRWQPQDPGGRMTPSIWDGADALLDSRIIPHKERWTRTYPPKAELLGYLSETLSRLLRTVENCGEEQLERARLALVHEDMHAEALLMTLQTLGQPLPAFVARQPLDPADGDLVFDGGEINLGESDRAFRFDNEQPAFPVRIEPFAIAAQPVSAEALRAFRASAEFSDAALWDEDGLASRAKQRRAYDQGDGFAAMHVSWFEARAFCRALNRRLPTEAEWEFAARQCAEFRASCGHVWEWTNSVFHPHPGFVPGTYADYSAPWFGDHTVLKGGSFGAVPRLCYPQYRNFYRPGRSDMFCGFRTCAID
ncbi:MAG: SUMF1/EgtB/PvdO family nonheme iron enzyme [Betaproteobacteria bacterium]|nr:SUMF1/EgtB/PvdO family nonheme iron enzyme [Betaproteobacteria bacterium]